MMAQWKRGFLRSLLGLAVLSVLVLPGMAETTPDVVVAACDSAWIVSLIVAGSCDQTGGGIGMLCGAVLDSGIILTAGHGFWCGEDGASGVMRDPSVEANGVSIPLNSLSPTGLEVYVGYDLALVDISGIQEFATGLRVAAEVQQTPSLVASSVWIIGYGRSSRPIVVAGQVTEGGQYAGDEMEISIDVPITPGLSGSPVFNAAGEIIGVVVAKSLIEPKIYATCVTQSFIESRIIRRR